jgi:ketosteroid isomerase-like protein
MATLEQRLQRLEDIAAIQRLKHAYGRFIDAGISRREPFPQDALMAQFTDDAIWEANYHGRFEGKPAIREFFAPIPEAVTFSLHYLLGSTIDIAPSGVEATGHWYTFETLTVGGRAAWLAATYDDRYVKENGRWLFRHVTAKIFFFTPYESGWVKEPFLP